MRQSISQKKPISDQEQLKISSLSIQFTLFSQSIKSITLKNIHEVDALAYKIKTNNLQAVEVTPNYGFIKANTSLSLRIKVTLEVFDAKLLVSYCNAGEKPGEFEDIWNMDQGKKIKNITVRVYRMGTKQLDNIHQKQPKKIQTNLQTNFKRSNSQDRSQTTLNLKQDIESTQNQLNPSTQQFHQKFLEQQTANIKLKQQLEITEQKLKIINQERLQIKVTKSIGIICEDYHTSFTVLVLYGLAAFVVGYVLAKWERL